MKKFLALVLALALVLSLAACGCNSNEEATDATDATEEQSSETVEIEPGVNGVLKMGTNAAFPPYEYKEGEEIVGIDAEIAAAIAAKLGKTLEIVDMEFDSIITSVQTGGIDVGIAGMTVTDERLESVNFTYSYATGVQVVIVKDGGNVASLDDLAGKKIGTQQGTTGHIYASDEYGSDMVIGYPKGADAIMALQRGDIEAVIIDNEPAKAYVAANNK